VDAWIAFEPLSLQVVERVVDKFIGELNAQLADKRIKVVLKESARAWLAQNGFDRLNGARPMARLIQAKIKAPLAEQMLFAEREMSGEVEVYAEGSELILRFPDNENQKPV
jgi:ATP-dependent Clp protease ATP-binding subunit ClpA